MGNNKRAFGAAYVGIPVASCSIHAPAGGATKLAEVATFAPEQIQNMPAEPIDPARLVEVNPKTPDTDYINIFLDEFGASIGNPAPAGGATR